MGDIAEKLGISKNSVSLALSGKDGVSDALRARIVHTAQEMHYGGYSALNEWRNRYILVLVPEYLHNDVFFYSDVLWAIEAEAKRLRCIAINSSITREMEASGTLPPALEELQLQVLGLLTVGVFGEGYIARLHALGLPMLAVDIAYNGVPVGCVGTANLSGGYLAAKHLLEQGHRDIGFVGPVYAAQSVYERYCGFRQALERRGIPVNASRNILGAPGEAFRLFDTAEVLEPYIDAMQSMPTAWFCAGDRIAIAMMNALAKRGIRVPEDVSVMGFDDIAVAQMILPALTTVRLDRKLMGKLAVDFLLDQGEKRGVININLPCQLVVRDSVCAPRAQAE